MASARPSGAAKSVGNSKAPVPQDAGLLPRQPRPGTERIACRKCCAPKVEACAAHGSCSPQLLSRIPAKAAAARGLWPGAACGAILCGGSRIAEAEETAGGPTVEEEDGCQQAGLERGAEVVHRRPPLWPQTPVNETRQQTSCQNLSMQQLLGIFPGQLEAQLPVWNTVRAPCSRLPPAWGCAL